MAQVKIVNFYGSAVPRPQLVFDANGKPIKDRVDATGVNDPLIKWASKVPYSKGGLLQKPRTYEGETVAGANTPFGIFIEDKKADILASNPHLLNDSDDKAFRAAAGLYWKTNLTEDERKEYTRRSNEERERYKASIIDLEQHNPEFKAYREKSSMYQKAVSATNKATRLASGPLYRLAPIMKEKYPEEKNNKKARRVKKRRVVVGSDTESESDEEWAQTEKETKAAAKKRVPITKRGKRARVTKGLANVVKTVPAKVLGRRSKQFNKTVQKKIQKTTGTTGVNALAAAAVVVDMPTTRADRVEMREGRKEVVVVDNKKNKEENTAAAAKRSRTNRRK